MKSKGILIFIAVLGALQKHRYRGGVGPDGMSANSAAPKRLYGSGREPFPI